MDDRVAHVPPSPAPSEAARRWHARRTIGGGALPGATELAALKRSSAVRVSVVLPALNESATVGEMCETIRDRLMIPGPRALVDELLVVDGASVDGTRAVAEAAGARVVGVSELIPHIPAAAGKGEALWRSLSVLTGDIVVWVDADIRNFTPRFVTRLIAPLLADPSIAFVKGFYRRPIARGRDLIADEGGRVTELLARPLLAALFPELGGFAQPLAGEYAGRTEVLRRVPFFTGYSVEVGLLIDLLELLGLDALAQVDLGERVHRNRPLGELAPMAHAIARTILGRARERGRLRSTMDVASFPVLRPTPDGIETHDLDEIERPPIEGALGPLQRSSASRNNSSLWASRKKSSPK